MSHAHDLGVMRGDLDFLLEPVSHGTADRSRRYIRHDLGQKNAQARIAEQVFTEGERGGSSSPREVEDRAEAARLHAQSIRDVDDAPRLIRVALDALSKLRQIAVRQTETIGDVPIPDIPGCRSCARRSKEKGQQIGGHFAPAMPAKDLVVDGVTVRGNAKAARERLCRRCFDVFDATGDLPPVMYCELAHMQSARAAGLWLADQKRGAA